MKKELLLVIAGSLSFGQMALAQNYTELMKEAEREKLEHKSNCAEINENQIFSSDYASYVQAKAWNYRAQTVFTNPNNPALLIGGRYNDILVDRTNNIGLAAANGGGLFSFNPAAPTTFKPVDDFAAFMPASCIEQNPNNKLEVLVGTGAYDQVNIDGFGAYRSTDGGKTFTKITSTDPLINADFAKIYDIKYSPSTANTIYLATQKVLYRSTDNGSTWNQVLKVTTGMNNIITSLDFLAGTGVAVTFSNSGLYTSATGNNNTFSLVTTTLPNNANATTGSNGSLRGCEVASFAKDRNTVFAYFSVENSANNSGWGDFDLYKSTNNGTTWSKVSSTFPNLYIMQEDYCLNLAIHPTNANNIIISSVRWGYSTDGGVSWNSAEMGEVDYHCSNFESSNPNVAWLGFDQGIVCADFGSTGTYNGKSQIKQTEYTKDGKTVASQVHNVDYFPQSYGDAFVMGQQDGGTFVSYPTDANPRWRITIGDAFDVFVNKQDPKVVWTSRQYNDVYNTTTQGTNLNMYTSGVETMQKVNAASSYTQGIWFTNFAGNNADGKMIFIPTLSGVRRTKDNGATFSTLITYSNRTWNKIAVQEAADPVIYVVGKPASGGANILRVANAGTATSPSSTTINNIFASSTASPDKISIDPNDVNTVYVCASNGEAVKITGANTVTPTITSIKGNLPNVVFNTVIAPKNFPNYLIAGTNVGLFYSTDKGVTWELSYEVPGTQINDLKLRNSDNRLFISTYGRGVWIVTVGGITTATEEASNISFKVYPNPASSSINIQSDFTQNSSVIIYNALGEKVLESSAKQNIDISSLSSGAYMVHLVNNNNEVLSTEKIIVKQ